MELDAVNQELLVAIHELLTKPFPEINVFHNVDIEAFVEENFNKEWNDGI